MPKTYSLCFDLGGTKLAAGLVSHTGKITGYTKVSVETSKGFAGLVATFAQLGKDLLAQAPPINGVAVSSAGPLDPETGVLLDPTNFLTRGHGWGILPLRAELRRVFRRPVWVDNDAACALLAEVWKGSAKGYKNALVMTLGTGVGIGILANGRLVRAGRGLHPEAGHLSLNAFDHTHKCACGAYGCIEAYLSGVHFAKEVGTSMQRPELTGEELVAMAKAGDPSAREWLQVYGERLAMAIRELSMIYAPEIVVLAGGFTAASKYFLPQTRKVLGPLFRRHREGVDMEPRLTVSQFSEQAGLLGAARMFRLRTSK